MHTLKPQKKIRECQLNRPYFEDTSLRKAYLILEYAHDSALALRTAFDDIRKARANRGAPTDEEQDLLRAMLVLAGAGLDSMLKQIIRDTLGTLVDKDSDVASALEEFVRRRVRGDADDDEIAGHKFVARIFVAESMRAELIEQYIRHLTGSSLQSVEELRRALSALCISTETFAVDAKELKKIFGVRNTIIHELDINFEARTRNRHGRKRDTMIGYTNALLETGENILSAIEEKLAA